MEGKRGKIIKNKFTQQKKSHEKEMKEDGNK